jgi:hypothetical protein
MSGIISSCSIAHRLQHLENQVHTSSRIINVQYFSVRFLTIFKYQSGAIAVSHHHVTMPASVTNQAISSVFKISSNFFSKFDKISSWFCQFNILGKSICSKSLVWCSGAKVFILSFEYHRERELID